VITHFHGLSSRLGRAIGTDVGRKDSIEYVTTRPFPARIARCKCQTAQAEIG